jgi:hypothetical protein
MRLLLEDFLAALVGTAAAQETATTAAQETATTAAQEIHAEDFPECAVSRRSLDPAWATVKETLAYRYAF